MTDDTRKTTPPPKLTAQPLAPVVDAVGFTASVIVALGHMPGKGRAVVFFKDGQPVSSEPVLADNKGIATQRFDIAGGFKTPVSVGAVIMGGPTLQFTVNPIEAEKPKSGRDRRFHAELTAEETDESTGMRIYQYLFLLNDESGNGVAGGFEFTAGPAPGVKYLKVEASLSHRKMIEGLQHLTPLISWSDTVPETGICKAVIALTKDAKVGIVIAGWPDDPFELRLSGPRQVSTTRFFKNWS